MHFIENAIFLSLLLQFWQNAAYCLVNIVKTFCMQIILYYRCSTQNVGNWYSEKEKKKGIL